MAALAPPVLPMLARLSRELPEGDHLPLARSCDPDQLETSPPDLPAVPRPA